MALALYQLTSCTTAQPWRGFSGPAYLPARPVHHPAPAVPAPASAARIRHLDSLAAAGWAAPVKLFKP